MRKLACLAAALVAATLLFSAPAEAFRGGGFGGFHGGGFGGFHGGGWGGGWNRGGWGRGIGWGAAGLAGLGLGLAATAPAWGYDTYYPYGGGYAYPYPPYGGGYACVPGYNCIAPYPPYGGYGYGW
jgi:hypothetical protein